MRGVFPAPAGSSIEQGNASRILAAAGRTPSLASGPSGRTRAPDSVAVAIDERFDSFQHFGQRRLRSEVIVMLPPQLGQSFSMILALEPRGSLLALRL